MNKDFKYGDIVVSKGELGTVVINDNNLYLLPPGFGAYRYSMLEKLADDAEYASDSEKFEFIIQDFSWGYVINTHQIGDIQILETKDEPADNAKIKNCQTRFHAYIDFKDIHRCGFSLDKAIIEALAYKYDGDNSQASKFIQRMLNMDKESDCIGE